MGNDIVTANLGPRELTDYEKFDLMLNRIDVMDVHTSYRIEQGFTFELNLAGVADEHRDEFVATGKPKSNTTAPKGDSK